MDGYKVVFEHEVLFRDLDALRHVNNVAFLAFMEDARMRYWKALTRKHDLKGIKNEKNLYIINIFVASQYAACFLRPSCY